MVARYIFHACTRAAWVKAKAEGSYGGSADDRRDGFLHFSDLTQIAESTATHHAGEKDLVLLVVRVDAVGDALRWEPSRSGRLFPHLYASLPVAAVVEVLDLPLDKEGRHVFPSLPEA
ncbi:MAG: DUF952 domain-containing protein [Pseudomonadota bacterium]